MSHMGMLDGKVKMAMHMVLPVRGKTENKWWGMNGSMGNGIWWVWWNKDIEGGEQMGNEQWCGCEVSTLNSHSLL